MTDLIKDADYWKNYRKSLLQTVEQKEKEPKLEKTRKTFLKRQKNAE